MGTSAVITQNSVLNWVAVSAVVSSQGTSSATSITGLAGKISIGVNHLEETSGTDALSIHEGTVVLGETGETSAG